MTRPIDGYHNGRTRPTSHGSAHPTCRAVGCLEPPADGDWCTEHDVAVELIREIVLAKSTKLDKNGNRWYAR